MTVPSDSPGAVRERLPDFFIVGHPKCGTTALYEMLKRHPQIYMSALKEPQFFASEMRVGAPEHNGMLPTTLAQYLSLFAPAGPEQRAGEASPSYLRSKTAAELIAGVQPAARIIAIVREPASFLHSVHLQFVQAMIEPEYDLRRALALEQDRREGRDVPRNSYWPQALYYSEHVRYVEQLRRFHAAFPPEQMLVLIYDDFRADNEASVRAVLRFLEVDDTVALETIEANPTVRARSQRLHRLMRVASAGQNPLARAARTTVKALTPERLRGEAMQALRRRFVYDAPRPPDPDLMLELRRRFKTEVVALGEELDRDLVTLWGYDSID
jgi:hypothetical protein